jgi:hypothetical protein
MGNTILVRGTSHNYKSKEQKVSLWNNSRLQIRYKNSSSKQIMTTKIKNEKNMFTEHHGYKKGTKTLVFRKQNIT